MTWTRRIEDLIVVTLITLVIWFYAESRTLESPDPVTVGLELRAAGDDRVIVSQSVTNVRVRFAGANSAISRLQSRLPGKLQVTLASLEPGRQTLSLAEVLPQASVLANMSVNITEVEPATVEVTVARLVTHDAELAFKTDEVKLQDNEAKITPDKVRLTLPEDKLSEVTTDGKLVLYVKPSREIRSLPANVTQALPVRIELPASLQNNVNVRVEPGEATLSFIIAQKGDTHTLNTVPVVITLPPAELRNFDVQLHEEDRFLKDVKVTGPADLVEQVKSGAVTLEARVKFSRDDLVDAAKKGAEATYAVKFVDVPAGLTVEGPKNSVRVVIRRPTP